MPNYYKLWDDGGACLIVKEADPEVIAEWNPQTLDERQKWNDQLVSEIAELQKCISEMHPADESKVVTEINLKACQVYNSNLGYTQAIADLAEKQSLLACLNGEVA